jgi:hypothetical protein
MPFTLLAHTASSDVARARPDIEKRLRRFPLRHRRAVKAMAERHIRVADLAISFPALLFALAVPRSGFDPTPIIGAVIGGAPLRDLALQAGLPMWLRKLMPEAFERPLEALPDGDVVGMQIANHLPHLPKLAPRWLRAVCHVWVWGTPAAAVWMARENSRGTTSMREADLNLVSLYAWFSAADLTFAGKLIDKAWQSELRLSTALRYARCWLDDITLRAHLGGKPIDPWLASGVVDGFEFSPLSTEEAIGAEAKAMRNCIRRYVHSLTSNRSRLWSVQRNGERVATLEVRRWRADPLLQISQLLGPRNAPAATPVWWAARKWLHSQDLLAITPTVNKETVALDRHRWIELWRPYWLAKRRLPLWLPIAPSSKAIRDLMI